MPRLPKAGGDSNDGGGEGDNKSESGNPDGSQGRPRAGSAGAAAAKGDDPCKVM